jgi:hypothetical protein
VGFRPSHDVGDFRSGSSAVGMAQRWPASTSTARLISTGTASRCIRDPILTTASRTLLRSVVTQFYLFRLAAFMNRTASALQSESWFLPFSFA